jgi:hypothetical protein
MSGVEREYEFLREKIAGQGPTEQSHWRDQGLQWALVPQKKKTTITRAEPRNNTNNKNKTKNNDNKNNMNEAESIRRR